MNYVKVITLEKNLIYVTRIFSQSRVSKGVQILGMYLLFQYVISQ